MHFTNHYLFYSYRFLISFKKPLKINQWPLTSEILFNEPFAVSLEKLPICTFRVFRSSLIFSTRNTFNSRKTLHIEDLLNVINHCRVSGRKGHDWTNLISHFFIEIISNFVDFEHPSTRCG